MSKTPWLHKVWPCFKIRTWLFIFLGFAVAGLALGIFLIRRQLIEYRPTHTFNVSAPEFFGSAHALGDPIPVAGNKVTLLQNGDEIFAGMLEVIRGAEKTVNFQAYIFNSDEIGKEFEQALMERARAGVKVRVLLDGVGASSKLNNSEVDELKKAGCEFAYYHPLLSLRLDKLNRRSHRRVLVVDGKVGFLGGVGFSKDWSGHAESPVHWRDMQAKVEGPLVAKLQGAFQQHWGKETKQAMAGEGDFPALEPAGDLKGQLTASHSYSIAAIPWAQAVAIAASEKRVWITNAYCTPTEEQIELLVKAVGRGVDVRMLVPGEHNDQPLTKSVGRTAYGDLLKGGVKIYEYAPTMIHQKTMVVDSLFSLLGTSNLDARSSQLNEEIDLTIYDGGFGQQMEQVFEKDLAQARQYSLEEFQKRGLWERFSEWFMRPFRSQL